jgi:signal transduction histidine kinase
LKFPRRRLLLLAGPVLLPGLILAYLSFRSVKDERLLLEKTQEARYEALADAVEETLRKTRQAYLERLRAELAEGGSGETPLEAWALAARVLENPLIHSAVVFRGEEPVFPSLPRGEIGARADSLLAAPRPRHPLERIVRDEWRSGRPEAALRALRALLHGPDSLAAGPAGGTEARFGYRLLELKCLLRLGAAEEAVAGARALVQDLLASADLESHHRTGFYLSEIADLMTARENLPRDARGEFFALHQRLPAFLANADAVARDWPEAPAEILRNQAFTPGDSLRVQYHAGDPYLLIRFPWLQGVTQLLARLDEGVFTAALRAELAQGRRTAWRDADFAVFNPRDETVIGGEPGREREPALERSLEDQFPAWRLVVYKRPAGELITQGRRRILLQYTLLGFSLVSLLAGLVVLFKGLDDAQRLVSMKANFLSAVSHELKTPLTAIRMFSEMMTSGRAPGEKGVQYAGRIGAEAERLQGMIEGILTYTRLEDEPGALRFEETDLSAVARESAGLLAEAFARAGIRLTLQLAPRAPLRADYNALRSVVQNLLENALKYSRPNTGVTLEVSAGNEEIVLRVADQGIGIAPDDLKRIFDKFYRAGDEMTRKTRGSGLGLALVKRIADAHGASIRVNSETGAGTEMIVSFPRKA